jgi:hypothetical protein
MKRILLLICFATPAMAEPRLVPSRDVAVDYTVQPRDRQAVQVHVEIEGGGGHLRITSPELPTAFLVDRPAETATILLPMLKLFATVGIAKYDPEQSVLRGAHFDRHGVRFLDGLVCTDWTAFSAQGHASACITDDGVILTGTASDRHGLLGAVHATTVQYRALPPILFRRPDGYRNAGSIPVDSGVAAGWPK